MEGEAAPAGADLQHLIPGLQRQFAADALQLGGGGLRQGHVRALEDRAGVHEGLVQPKAVEIIAQVVMGGDVTATTGAVVAAGAMQQGAQGRREPGDPPFHVHHRRPVAQQQAYQAGQILAIPVTGHEGLAGADGAAKGQGRPEGGIAHLHLEERLAGAKLPLPVGLAHPELAGLEARQLVQDQPAGQGLEGGGAPGYREGEMGGKGLFVHALTPGQAPPWGGRMAGGR